MNCDSVRERLSAYIDGELSEIERYRVNHHLVRCVGCATEEQQLREVVALLSAVEEPDLPADFRMRLRERLITASGPAAVRPKAVPLQVWRRWGVPAAAAAAAALLMFHQVQSQPAPPAVEVAAVNQPSAPSQPNGEVGQGLAATLADNIETGRPGEAVQPYTPPAAGGTGAPAPGPLLSSQVAANPSTPATGGVPGGSPGAAPGQTQQPGPQAGTGGQPVHPPAPVGGPVSVATPGERSGPKPAAPGTMLQVTHYVRIQAPLAKELDQRVRETAARFGARVTDASSSDAEARYYLAVSQDKAADLASALAALGQPLAAAQPGVSDLTELYNTTQAQLKGWQNAQAQYEAWLADPAATEADKAEARAQLDTIRQRIAKLTYDLEQLEERARTDNVVLIIEADRGTQQVE